MVSDPPLEEGDQGLLQRVAERVVALRVELPAILTLESSKPIALLASQTMHFFEPMAGAILPLPDYRRFAKLLERRDAIERLIRLIESGADRAHAERRAARAAAAKGKSKASGGS